MSAHLAPLGGARLSACSPRAGSCASPREWNLGRLLGTSCCSKSFGGEYCDAQRSRRIRLSNSQQHNGKYLLRNLFEALWIYRFVRGHLANRRVVERLRPM